MKFNKEDWMNGEIDYYPNRKAMLYDLILHHNLVGLSYHQLIDSLGEPDLKDEDTSVGYQIEIYYDVIDPDHGEDLYFKLSKDSTVLYYHINDWKRH